MVLGKGDQKPCPAQVVRLACVGPPLAPTVSARERWGAHGNSHAASRPWSTLPPHLAGSLLWGFLQWLQVSDVTSNLLLPSGTSPSAC